MSFTGSGTVRCGKHAPRCCEQSVMRRPGHAVAFAGFGPARCGKCAPRCCGQSVMRRPRHGVSFAGFGTAQCGKRALRCCRLPVMRRLETAFGAGGRPSAYAEPVTHRKALTPGLIIGGKEWKDKKGSAAALPFNCPGHGFEATGAEPGFGPQGRLFAGRKLPFGSRRRPMGWKMIVKSTFRQLKNESKGIF